MPDLELELRREIARSERARAYIEDPLLVDAFERVRQYYMGAWVASPPEAREFRETTYHHIQALAEVRAELNRVLEDGLLAQERLAELRAGIANP